MITPVAALPVRGVTYGRFLVVHQPVVGVMDRPDLYHAGGTDLRDARARAAEVLHQPTGTLDDAGPAEAGMALWAVMHGVAALFLSGILPVPLSDDPDQVARAAASSVLQRPTLYEMP